MFVFVSYPSEKHIFIFAIKGTFSANDLLGCPASGLLTYTNSDYSEFMIYKKITKAQKLLS